MALSSQKVGSPASRQSWSDLKGERREDAMRSIVYSELEGSDSRSAVEFQLKIHVERAKRKQKP
jgi:hypothetical protein